MRQHLPDVPVVLVGNKIDLRSDESALQVTFDQGKEASERIGAKGYVECSAKNAENVKEVFRAATAAATAKSG